MSHHRLNWLFLSLYVSTYLNLSRLLIEQGLGLLVEERGRHTADNLVDFLVLNVDGGYVDLSGLLHLDDLRVEQLRLDLFHLDIGFVDHNVVHLAIIVVVVVDLNVRNTRFLIHSFVGDSDIILLVVHLLHDHFFVHVERGAISPLDVRPVSGRVKAALIDLLS